MRTRSVQITLVIMFLVLLLPGSGAAQSPAPATPAAALVGTAFTYQGFLRGPGGSAVAGTCDFQFSLFDDAAAGSQVGSTITISSLNLVDGRFTVQLDFGGQFTGEGRWLQVGVRCPAGSGGYTTLTPRQTITPGPYALALPGIRTVPAQDTVNIIAGSIGNGTSAIGATISGGGNAAQPNYVYSDYGTIGGGVNNRAGSNISIYLTPYATIGGGANNLAEGYGATIAGGVNNSVTGGNSTIIGGYGNIVSGAYSTVLGGSDNEISGDGSVAGGHRAKAIYEGTFVWADNSTVDFASTGPKQFFVRASGGVYFYASPNGDNGGHCILPANGTGWSCSSDVNLKENFASVDPQTILDQLAGMQITRWNVKDQDASIQHIGPAAQDFFAAFGLGDDERLISTTDAQGVALAAIQGLYQINREQQAKIQAQKSEIEALQRHQSDLEARLERLEAAQGKSAPASAPLSGAALPAWLIVAGAILGGTTFWQTTRVLGGRRK